MAGNMEWRSPSKSFASMIIRDINFELLCKSDSIRAGGIVIKESFLACGSFANIYIHKR
jgi:hypothetical protein